MTRSGKRSILSAACGTHTERKTFGKSALV